MAIGSDEVDQRDSGDTVADRNPRLAPTSFLERLPRLLDELRTQGFSASVDQHVAVNELFIGLAARKAFPLQDPAVFGRLLCPLFAKSPLQQEIFAAVFENWLRRLSTTEPEILDGFCLWLAPTKKTSSALEDRKHDGLADFRTKDQKHDSIILLRWNRYIGRFIVSLVAIGFLAGAISGIEQFYYSKPTQTSQQEPRSKGEPPRLVQREIDHGAILRELIWITTCSVPLLLLLLIFMRRRVDVHLQRKLAGELPETTSIHVEFPISPLFKSNSLVKTSYDFRRSRLVNQNRLDPEATVQASVRVGGFFLPVSIRRRVIPEYLVLIDRRTFADQSTALTETLLARLAGDGVALSMYYFDRSARFCFPRTILKEGLGRSVPIDELADRHADSRLLVFADLLHILQPGSNRPQSWIHRLAQWESPAVFVRRSDETANLIHDLLRTLGFSVFPATESGLRAYADFINGHPEQLSFGETVVPKHQSLSDLLDNESVWLGHHGPDVSRVDSMFAGVRSALGQTGFLCLSASAIYPEITWKLTVYLVREICRTEGSQESPEDLLGRLAILPWFRHARMPDWLRVRLITGLESTQEKTIRQLIENLFLSALDAKTDSQSIFKIARDNPSIRSRILRALGRRASYSKVGVTAVADPFREHIFATFIGSRLSFRLPRAVRAVIYSRNLPGISPAIRTLRWSLTRGSLAADKIAFARVLGVGCLITYMLAMFVPALHKSANVPGWQALRQAIVIVMGFHGFPLDLRNPIDRPEVLCFAGVLANVLFVFGTITFLCRVFLSWSWPSRLATSFISGLSMLCAMASTMIFVDFPMRFRVGFFLWLLSPILLFVANLFSSRKPKRRRFRVSSDLSGVNARSG